MHIVCSHGTGESICIKVTGRCLIFIIFGGMIYVLADKSITTPGSQFAMAVLGCRSLVLDNV